MILCAEWFNHGIPRIPTMPFTIDSKPSDWMVAVAAFIAIAVTTAVIFIAIAPYFGYNPERGNGTLLAQQQTILQNVFISIVAFFFGYSAGTSRKDETISTLATATNADGVRKSAPDAAPIPPNV
jgi:hypothetical protein